MELEELLMESERDRLQRYSDCDFLVQVKQNADTYLDRICSNDRKKRETVKKELIQVSVHPSVLWRKCFQALKVDSECRVLCNEIDSGVLCQLLEDVHHDFF